MVDKPRLYGIKYSNRDFSQKEAWGKNQFNSSFPAALACYLYSKGLSAVYITADENMDRVMKTIDIYDLYKIDPLSDEIYFSFETQYIPYQKYVIGSIPRNDLVIMSNERCISSFEIKLVALPDNSTCDMPDDKYGSEIVVRPDTIVYLACSFIKSFDGDRKVLGDIFAKSCCEISDWSDPEKVLPYTYEIFMCIKELVKKCHLKQVPIIMEPVWRTEGKSPRLSRNCLDIFIWSNCGLLMLFMPSENDFLPTDDARKSLKKITRHFRAMIWLFKMLKDYSEHGCFNYSQIIDELSYNLKNDKAFSSNGMKTYPLMLCPELLKPRITKDEIKNIILGGGQELLSPERRFDAIIYNSPDLFDKE